MRINQRIRISGLCSRRQADRLIKVGRVLVNGKPAQLGQDVCGDDEIYVDGVALPISPAKQYWLYHKPVGVVSTNSKSVANNLTEATGLSERCFAVGRLDKESEGLMLLSNDGEIFNPVLQSDFGHEKTYRVTVDKAIAPEFLVQMANGVEILNTTTLPCQVEAISGESNQFQITLTQGLNRQIRRMCKALGYRVTRLQRLRIMHLSLEGLEAGELRELTEQEKSELLRLTRQL